MAVSEIDGGYKLVEYTKEQCLYALRECIDKCSVGLGENGSVLIATEIAVGIYNYLSDGEKMYFKSKESL